MRRAEIAPVLAVLSPLAVVLVAIALQNTGCGGYTEQAMNVERAHSAQLSEALDAVATQTAQYQRALVQARAELTALTERCAAAGAPTTATEPHAAEVPHE